MTSIRTYDPADGSAPPELPPLPIGVLAVAAADLPQPVYITISDTQSVDLLFASVKASVQALNRWAHRFGAIVTSQLGQGNGGTETWYRTDFGYYGIAVTAYAHIPAAPASS